MEGTSGAVEQSCFRELFWEAALKKEGRKLRFRGEFVRFRARPVTARPLDHVLQTCSCTDLRQGVPGSIRLG